MRTFTEEEEIAYRKQLPRKVISAGILLFNQKGELLIVKPNYRPHWLIVGGVIDEGEAPILGLQREIKEETGLTVTNLKCVIIDNMTINAFGKYQYDHLEFIFVADALTLEQTQNISLDEMELIEHQFLPFQQALNLLKDKMRYKIEQLKGNFEQLLFLKNGEIIQP